jgi:hypothetical protein
MTKPLGDHRHVVAAFAGPFMRIAHFDDANLAASTRARLGARRLSTSLQVGELRRCLQPAPKGSAMRRTSLILAAALCAVSHSQSPSRCAGPAPPMPTMAGGDVRQR